VKLDPSASDPESGEILISNANLAELAARGSLATVSGTVQAGHEGCQQDVADDVSKRRQEWRKRYRKQQERLIAASDKLAEIVASLGALRRFGGSGSSARAVASYLKKVEELAARKRLAEGRVDRERAELENIVNQARREGAEPGWFR
jgi:hypothetical protein